MTSSEDPDLVATSCYAGHKSSGMSLQGFYHVLCEQFKLNSRTQLLIFNIPSWTCSTHSRVLIVVGRGEGLSQGWPSTNFPEFSNQLIRCQTLQLPGSLEVLDVPGSAVIFACQDFHLS